MYTVLNEPIYSRVYGIETDIQLALNVFQFVRITSPYTEKLANTPSIKK